jgi:hypothetical protein
MPAKSGDKGRQHISDDNDSNGDGALRSGHVADSAVGGGRSADGAVGRRPSLISFAHGGGRAYSSFKHVASSLVSSLAVVAVLQRGKTVLRAVNPGFHQSSFAGRPTDSPCNDDLYR